MAYTLTLVKNAEGEYKRDLDLREPYKFWAVVEFTDTSAVDRTRQYSVKNLDEREQDTEEKVLAIARQQLRLELNEQEYNAEQMQAIREYNSALAHVQHGQMLIDFGIFRAGASDTETTINIDFRKTELKAAFLFCKQLGVELLGPDEAAVVGP